MRKQRLNYVPIYKGEYNMTPARYNKKYADQIHQNYIHRVVDKLFTSSIVVILVVVAIYALTF